MLFFKHLINGTLNATFRLSDKNDFSEVISGDTYTNYQFEMVTGFSITRDLLILNVGESLSISMNSDLIVDGTISHTSDIYHEFKRIK